MVRAAKKQREIFESPKGSGVWWVCYFDQYSRKHREKVGMKSRAAEIHRQRKEEIRLGKFTLEGVKGKHQNAMVAEVIEDYLQSCQAPSEGSGGNHVEGGLVEGAV
jgi:hypothetical protein